MIQEHLLTSQVDSILSSLERVGFQRTAFEWVKVDGSFAGLVSGTVPALFHSESAAYFAFAQVPTEWLARHHVRTRSKGGEHWIQFAPGSETPSEVHRELRWEEVLTFISQWGTYVQREMRAGLGVVELIPPEHLMDHAQEQSRTLQERQAVRANFLQRLYTAAAGSTAAAIPWQQISSELGISDDEAQNVISYLCSLGDAQRVSMAYLSITQQGMKTAEDGMIAATAKSPGPLPDVPPELQDSLAGFRKDHPEGRPTAFVMMKFGTGRAHKEITEAIRQALQPYGIAALRADDRQYHDDLFANILTYIYGCTFGIAVFERVEGEDFNPNVSLEVGYLMGLRKSVCLLKDRTLRTLPTDLTGKLYRQFDVHDPHGTIPIELNRWLADKGFVG
jgi:hypothetical protein